MKYVYVENQDNLLTNMFIEEGWIVTNKPLRADLICLEGGVDVTPELYGEKNTHSYSDTFVDVKTFGLINIAERLGIPIIGVCRGGQALCVYHGGSMKQDISNHAIGSRTHPVEYAGTKFNMCSAHHQGMVAGIKDLGEAELYYSEDENLEIIVRDTSVSFQPHPEYHPEGHECRKVFFHLIERLMGVDKSDSIVEAIA